MNTNGLARQYDKLTPWERVPLILAASLRGDVAESERLARSASTHCFRMPDYWGLSYGLIHLSKFLTLECLDLAAWYWRCLASLADTEELLGDKEPDRLWETMRMLAFRFVCLTDGWRKLCDGVKIDPDALLGHCPAADTLKRFEQEARAVAFTPEEALVYLKHGVEAGERAEGASPPVPREYRLQTVEEIAVEFREYLTEHLSDWS